MQLYDFATRRQVPLPLQQPAPLVKASLPLSRTAGLDEWPELQAWEPGWWRSFRRAPLRARLHLMLER